MPVANHFRHQRYTSARPTAPFELITPAEQPRVGSAELRDRMAIVGQQISAHGVAEIYLIHGSFVGDDMLGLNQSLSALFPKAATAGRNGVKRLMDCVMEDVTNYTRDYVRLLRNSLATNLPAPIPVRRFVWSSLNNHVGRAVAAVRLIHSLMQRETVAGDRLLLWGHSHAGNVMALMTNLLAADRDSLQRFFDALDGYARDRIPGWQEVRQALQDGVKPLAGLRLDLVTFGTPIRYGWDSGGYSQLLHFINHRPRPGRPPYLTSPPKTLCDLLNGADGDYVQQIGIEGSNFSSPLLWRLWVAERRLVRFLAPDFPWHRIRSRVKKGMRVPHEGTTLLVDYGLGNSQWVKHVWGHASYTRTEWMLYHLEEVARRFYASSPNDDHEKK